MSTCRYCAAAWPTVMPECEHTDRDGEVARQIAALIHSKEPTDEQVGWFMENAEVLNAYVKDPEATVRWEPRTWRIRFGGGVWKVDEEDGGLRLMKPPPESVARQREAAQ